MFLTGLVISVVLGSGVPPVFMLLFWSGCTSLAACTGAPALVLAAYPPSWLLHALSAQLAYLRPEMWVHPRSCLCWGGSPCQPAPGRCLRRASDPPMQAPHFSTAPAEAAGASPEAQEAEAVDLPPAGAVFGSLCGTSCWLAYAKIQYGAILGARLIGCGCWLCRAYLRPLRGAGKINATNLSQNYSLLSGAVVSLGMSLLVCVVISLILPNKQRFRWAAPPPPVGALASSLTCP